MRKKFRAFLCCTATMIACLLGFTSSVHADEGMGSGDANAAEARLSALFTAAAEAPKRAHWDAYLSGYAHHGRTTYSENQLRKMNENTWGGGLGRTLRDDKGNDESLYVVGMRDSHERPQWLAGYAYQWKFPLKVTSMEAGVGLTGLLIRRHDWFDGRPFPAILPVASLGTRNAQLVATYVPRLPGKKIRGDILLLMLKMSL